jgi:hypothetical protein
MLLRQARTGGRCLLCAIPESNCLSSISRVAHWIDYQKWHIFIFFIIIII